MDAYYVYQVQKNLHGTTERITFLYGELCYSRYSDKEQTVLIEELKVLRARTIIIEPEKKIITVQRSINAIGLGTIIETNQYKIQKKTEHNTLTKIVETVKPEQIFIMSENEIEIIRPTLEDYLNATKKQKKTSILDKFV